MQAAYENTGCNERNLYSSTNTIPAISSLKFCTKSETSMLFLHGIRDAFPIGLGYFAVSFSLGIAASMAGLNWIQGMFLSLLNNASAGEYAGISAIRDGPSYLAIALLIFTANARYLLMSCALSQKLSPSLPLHHRMLIAFDITDELFGLAIARPGYAEPAYMYGAYLMGMISWAGGTVGGVLAGNVLPAIVVTALSASIYGMFLAIIMPPAKKNRTVLFVVLSGFLLSSICSVLPIISGISESVRIILLTLFIAGTAAILHPVSDEKSSQSTAENAA